MPRKKPTANSMQVAAGKRGTASVRMNDAEIRRIDAAARLRGVSRGEILRGAGLAEADRIIRETAERRGG